MDAGPSPLTPPFQLVIARDRLRRPAVSCERMDDVLALCAGFPERTFAPGEVLLREGASSGTLFVLTDGAVQVRKGAVVITTVDAPGSFVGEISAMLGTPHTADVIADRPTRALVIEDAAATIAATPALAIAIGRLLARRLQAVTSYLADIRRQYADADGHLAMMDKVLGELISTRPRSLDLGSERPDVPDY